MVILNPVESIANSIQIRRSQSFTFCINEFYVPYHPKYICEMDCIQTHDA